MPLEYSTIILPLDERQQESLDAKAREGWQLVPGVPPIGIWQVCRALPEPIVQASGFGTLHIDDSKIFILRDGKYLDAAGNEVPPEKVPQ
jgi:hypothetical protein